MGMRQEYKKLKILNAELLPSDIIYLQFKRPSSFSFRSGQWVRISSPAFSCAFNECHAFSLASAPQAPTLELYIKAVGPWTWKMRSEIIRAQANGSPYPLVHMNGPYGDGNQDMLLSSVIASLTLRTVSLQRSKIINQTLIKSS
ncbi:unnamed protein product [Strongylus vulgaris]|uniref:FAD-binding FR-type domain-containing protein n=1 Tax=Strongylus vulgaris TaxID=40348 RepID=A0A3P7LXD4_STRVU|nr:unnamed protein product [Strongylus vulgaris]